MAGVLVVLAVSACGGMAATATPGGAGTATPAAAGSATPGTSGAGSDVAATPRPTAWPGNAVLAIEALGVADNEVREAISDFNQGVATEDLGLMREAAAGLSEIDVLLPNVERIEVFEPMRPLAAQYRAAIPEIAEAAREVTEAIDARDAEAIGTSSSRLARGLSLYAQLQPELAGWVEQSVEQQRLLVR